MDDLVKKLENSFIEDNIENFKDIIQTQAIIYDELDIDIPFYKKKIYLSNNFEIILIYWKLNHSTCYHSHPSNGCVLKVLSGQLKETLLHNGNKKESIFNINDVSYMHDEKGVHKIEALENSISMHIYSPPLYYDK